MRSVYEQRPGRVRIRRVRVACVLVVTATVTALTQMFASLAVGVLVRCVRPAASPRPTRRGIHRCSMTIALGNAELACDDVKQTCGGG